MIDLITRKRRISVAPRISYSGDLLICHVTRTLGAYRDVCVGCDHVARAEPD